MISPFHHPWLAGLFADNAAPADAPPARFRAGRKVVAGLQDAAPLS